MSLKFSNAHLWANCQASVSPSGHTPDYEHGDRSDARLEGEAAHWLANLVLRGSAASATEGLGEAAPNGWIVDAEMVAHTQAYVDLVRTHGPVASETEASLWGGLVNGRVDQHCTEGPSTLHIYEFKYGRRIVEVFDNPQAVLGAVAMKRPEHILIVIHVYQPRAYHPQGIHRRWTITAHELDLAGNELKLSARAVAEQKLHFASPGWQCELCPRSGNCAALAANFGAAYEIIRSSRRNRKLTGVELGVYGLWLEQMEDLVVAARKAVTAEIEGRMNGEFVPGWEILDKQRRTVWRGTLAEREFALGLRLTREVEMSPNEAIEAGADPRAVETLTDKLSSGVRLAPINKKRVAARFGVK